jgi:precorrin-2 dehydrogenase / sirohydrochlorin ferrochelatase
MLPLNLDVTRLRLVLVGTGEAALRRLHKLREAGAEALQIFSAAPTEEFAAAAGAQLVTRWPTAAELARAQLIFLADVPARERNELSAAARAAGIITHVEDKPALSDVQAPAVLRRGDLTIAVSTTGASPSLAVQLKEFLAGLFRPEWEGRLKEMSRLRETWREAGIAPAAIAEMTAQWVRDRGWLAGAAANRIAEAGAEGYLPPQDADADCGGQARRPDHVTQNQFRSA